MNVEALSTFKKWDFLFKFFKITKCFDGKWVKIFTTIKTPTAKRTKKFFKGLGRKSKYRRIMTGSPVTKNPLDL
ncbi:MAG: hypothetical protein CM15mV129_340 [uncultured marine virus]|nr:MAG: hypothetical protein CM15mV129_340 [uncultured marine virus]